MRRLAAALLLVSLAAACGCPADAPPADGGEPVDVPPRPDDPPSPDASHGTPTTPDAPTSGPAGPPAPRTPRPEDGRPQTDLLATKTIRVGGTPLSVWVADTEETRTVGLMHVRDMPEDRGMLFVYPAAGRRSFWMRNTLIPLSLAYITNDGRIAQLLDMQPQTLESHPSRVAVRLVLEVNQGWFRRHGIAEGAEVEGVTDLVGY